MDDKSGDQVEPEKEQEWSVTGNTVAGFVGVLAPAALVTICLGHSGVFWDFLLNADYCKFKALGYNSRSRHRLLLWIRNNVLTTCSYGPRLREQDLWRDGSILCSLINLLVPEACASPQNHCGERPVHGQTLALKYLGVPPVFTDEELTQRSLTPQQEEKFFRYLSSLHQIFSHSSNNSTSNMQFCTDYVSRGMGLVVGQQYQKAVFYIYPIPKRFYYQHPCDLEVLIKGPYGSLGHIIIPSVLHQAHRCQKPTDYTRSLYMTSKLNSISPTMQGTSFFRKLSLRQSTKVVDPSQQIVIKVKVTETRAKVSYVPQKTGIYEVRLVANGCHVVGSPHTVPVELSTGKTCLSNDSDTESDEDRRHERFVRRKKRIISRIVDFVDEKMLLQQDGTLVKMNHATPTKRIEELVERTEETSFESNQLVEYNVKKVVDTIEDELFEGNRGLQSNAEKLELQIADTFLENNQLANLSQTSTECVNVLQNIRKYETKSFSLDDPISDSEVQDQNLQHGSSVYEIMKTFSTKDPSKEKASIDNCIDLTLQRNYSVNNLRKVFDGSDGVPTTKTTSSRNSPSKVSRQSNVRWQPATQNQRDFESLDSLLHVRGNEDQVMWRNDPDLVQCHGRYNKNSDVSSAEYYEILNTSKPKQGHENTDTKLNRIGVVLTDYDKRQRYLKSVLVHHVNSIPKGKLSSWHNGYRNKTRSVENASSEDMLNSRLVIGVVERQKKFWQDKLKGHSSMYSTEDVTKHTLSFSINASKPVTTQTEVVNKLNYKPKSVQVQRNGNDERVSSETQVFDGKFASSECINRTTRITVNESSMHKSSSEGNIQDAKHCRNLTAYSPQIRKIEESIQYPSIQERKALLLKAYSETSVSRGEPKSLVKMSPAKHLTSTSPEEDTQQQETHSVTTSDILHQPAESKVQKVNKKSSFRRRARFKRAKLFFHHLEGSQPKRNAETVTKNRPNNHFQVQRCESAPCLDRQMNYTNNNNEEEERTINNSTQSLKISDRFLVDDLFRDIRGDPDKRFLGIPNKMAVVASLASFDTGSSKTDFESGNDDESELDQFSHSPKRKKIKMISSQGFHEEYPHPPMTERWQYRSRSNLDLAGLIPRRILLGQFANELDV